MLLNQLRSSSGTDVRTAKHVTCTKEQDSRQCRKTTGDIGQILRPVLDNPSLYRIEEADSNAIN